MDQFTLTSKYIAPWALAKENLPVHMTWDQPLDYDSIHINIPSDLTIVEFFNVKTYVEKEHNYIISELRTPNYFGFVILSKEKIRDMHIQREIIVNFIKNGVEIQSESFFANIFRPILNLKKAPESIKLTNDPQKNLLNIEVELSGFGHIEIRHEVSAGGNLTAKLEPLYQEAIRRVIIALESGEDFRDENNGIKINPDFIQEKTIELIDMLKSGKVETDLEEEDFEEFKEWINNESNYQIIMELFAKHLESALINSLLYFIERNPVDNITMAQGSPSVVIETFTQNVKVLIGYRDSMLNEYDPLLIEVKLEDERKDKSIKLDLPINIEWKLNGINPIEYCEGLKKND